jgi:serine protease AprX
MAKRVMVYVMHEHEREDARQALAQPYVTEGYVVGEADDARIDALRQQGLLVEELPERPAPPEHGLEHYGPEDLPVPGYYLVSIEPPVTPEVLASIGATGATLLERRNDLRPAPTLVADAQGRLRQVDAGAHHDWFVVHVTNDQQLVDVQQIRQVLAARPYDAEATRRYDPTAARMPGASRLWDIEIHPAEDPDGFAGWAAEEHIHVIAREGRRFRIAGDPDVADRCAARHEVAAVAPYAAPRLRLERSRPRIGVEPAPVVQGTKLDGSGVVVGVCDSGIEKGHPAFAGKVVHVIPRAGGDGSDPHGHGTHVAGTIAGNPAAPLDRYAGIAPAAQLVVQSVMDAQGNLSGIPLDLKTLLDEAYRHEVRIHNNSWGADVRGAYTLTSRDIDEFVWQHPDMLVVIAAGNHGTGEDPAPPVVRRTRPGFVDLSSVGAPASSKNGLVVGACRSDRQIGGWAAMTYRQLKPKRFGVDPIGAETVSGDPEKMAAFSSRGPCDGLRMKPDLVAPGTDIAAPRASTAPGGNFAGSVAGTDRAFGFMSGTSMAAPIVAGVAALVRQYVVQVRGHAPSAALLKALLVNGAVPLKGADAVADTEGLPSFHQGFGRVSLSTSIPVDGSFTLAFRDDWRTAAFAIPVSLQTRRRFRVTTTAAAPLSVTLAYTDHPGNGGQSNLSLVVEPPKPLTLQHPNPSIARLAFGPDRMNNVKVVRIDAAPPGDYLIGVIGEPVLEPLHFALVVSGALASDQLQEG